jgi:hypothetical protein
VHLEWISVDLDEGLSCVWLVPDELVDRGIADELLGELAARPDSIRVPPPEGVASCGSAVPVATRWPIAGSSAKELPSWARDKFGLLDLDEPFVPVAPPATSTAVATADRLLTMFDSSGEFHSDPIAVLAGSQWLRGKVIVVVGWEEQNPKAVGTLLTRLTALAKERGLSPDDRPRLLVAARVGDLPGAVLDRIDPVMTRVHWWWGSTGRLDTAVIVAAARPRTDRRVPVGRIEALRELVAVEVLTEVSGPDLVLAEGLASSWDGRLTTLRERLAHNVREVPEIAPLGPRGWGRSGNRPPHEIRAAWALGLANTWEGQVRISPAVSGGRKYAADLDALIWRGQNRALTPLVDEYRARLEETVRSRASAAVLAELTREDRQESRGGGPSPERNGRTTLELGGMAWAVGTGRVRFPRADADLLYCLRDIRNALAHLRPLTDDDLARMARVLPDDAW